MNQEVVAPVGGDQPVDAQGHGHEGMPQNGFSAAFQVCLDVARKIFFFWMMSTMFKSFFGGGVSGPNNASSVATTGPSQTYGAAFSSFYPGLRYSLHAYISENDKYEIRNPAEEIWSIPKLSFGDWVPGIDGTDSLHQDLTIPTPQSLLNNGSLYLHVFITALDKIPSGAKEVHTVTQLNKYKKHYYKKTANLISGESSKTKEELEKADLMKFEILNFFHPNMTINIVYDSPQFTKGQLVSPLDEFIMFDADARTYSPIVMSNDYWNLQKDYYPINSTVESIAIHLIFQPISVWKFQLYASQKVKPGWQKFMEVDESAGDQDSIKEALLETSPYLLGITVVVSLLHTVFEMLAFKNDIQFWKTRESLVGLSVRSVIFNIMQSLIVFLYVCDNDTNTMVKFSIGIGLLIECWKIPKVMDVKIIRTPGAFPRITFADKGSYVESDTKKYDQLAFRYLSWVLFPLLVGYAVYSLIYEEQKGWYSYVLGMLYGFLLMFGFITMTPQLFINYKLKSVAHLPWRMLTYKFINTFIDDLFAFVIKMPTLYRIGCLRDDVIFFVYLYQRWAYRVDPKRVNEFGTGGEPAVAAVEGVQDKTETEPAAIEETKKDK